MITYEYPFNERIRTLLRLEALFEKTQYFSRADGAMEHHAALLGLFDIIDVAGRSDLKMDMVHELERQRQLLLNLRHDPDISDTALSGALYEIEQSSTALMALSGKFGQALRDNDWLMNIKSRAAIPGGLCEFDLSSYHYWLNQPSSIRFAALENWMKPLKPVQDGLAIILRLLRSTGQPETLCAAMGNYQRMLNGKSITAQMAKIRIVRGELVVPEVSANRFVFNIRFTNTPGSELKARLCQRDVHFELTFCSL